MYFLTSDLHQQLQHLYFLIFIKSLDVVTILEKNTYSLLFDANSVLTEPEPWQYNLDLGECLQPNCLLQVLAAADGVQQQHSFTQ